TLAARLRRGPLSQTRASALGATLGDALAYVHERGIVHRDLKPANVLLGPGPRVRLADFGIARLLDASSLTVTGATLGTASYMAPEQIEHHGVGTAADVWSLGMILLESLLGQRVFQGTPAEVIARRLAGPLRLPPTLPAPWRMLLGSMLEEAPESRPSAAEVSGLISASAFKAPWRPSESDLAGIERPAPGGTATIPLGPLGYADANPGTGETLAGGVAPTLTSGQPTLANRPDPTIAGPPRIEQPTRKSRRWRYLIPLVLVLLLAAGLTAWALTSGPAPTPSHNAGRVTTTTVAPTTTTTPPTTTTTLITAGTAASNLERDVQNGVTNHAISERVASQILNQLNQTLMDANSGGATNGVVTSDVDQLDATIANGASSDDVSPAEASTLTADVASLATALGVSSTVTTNPTPATSTTVVGQTTPTPPSPGTSAPGPGGGGPGGNGKHGDH
ncbi:MAG: protein kinase domain-containing protein, partial [Acidimicrobiales bacterium]